MFVTPDGRNHLVPFCLITSLFLLWGFCNGMIDVMDKHFQEELGLTLSQSAWVQFAHYLGYFLMALPAGWLAGRLGYKGGVIGGLLLVAVGAFWFIPATQIAQFWAFLLGVCLIAAGLTFLETVANPYTTVLGAPQYAASRINLAQSFNGIGWVFGPVAGAMFFYGTDEQGRSTGSETLWIPYAAVGVVVLILAVIFLRAKLPEIKAEDDYHLDDKGAASRGVSAAPGGRGVSLALVWLNLVVLSASLGMIATAIATIFAPQAFRAVLLGASGLFLAVLTLAFAVGTRRITHNSIWLHPHFSGATLAQFFYVAAQSGIFAYFINYMTSQPPSPVANATASTLASVGFICFLTGRFIGAALVKRFPAHSVLGCFAAVNIILCAVIMLRLGWASVAAVFGTYFFMSIMFPTIFALGIHGLGIRSKRAAAYIVMAIMGGAIVPKLMGHIADLTNVSFSFIVPLVCFAVVSLYGFNWTRLGGKLDRVGTGALSSA
jgi:FHS family L-fucose permease-like MFS transporter